MTFVTDRIYTLDGHELLARSGDIEIDEASHFMLEQGDMGPLHVTKGLLPGDFAVFLSLEGTVEITDNTGYLVTDVRHDQNGSGIIVGGDLIESNPRTWATRRLYTIWQFLRSGGYDVGGEFGLTALEEYFQKHRPKS